MSNSYNNDPYNNDPWKNQDPWGQDRNQDPWQQEQNQNSREQSQDRSNWANQSYAQDQQRTAWVSDEDRRLATANSVVARSFGFMFLGLIVTTLVALWTYVSGAWYYVYASNIGYIAILIAELAIVFAATSAMRSNNVTLSGVLYFAYAAINGFTFASIFVVYNMASIINVFFIAASSFGLAAMFGALTKRNLSAMGNFFMIGLTGLIIASIVNIFLRSGGIDWMLSLIGVGLFAGLTAYDTQKIIAIAQNGYGTYNKNTLALWGAMELYLDFINLFLRLLRLFGRRNSD